MVIFQGGTTTQRANKSVYINIIASKGELGKGGGQPERGPKLWRPFSRLLEGVEGKGAQFGITSFEGGKEGLRREDAVPGRRTLVRGLY